MNRLVGRLTRGDGTDPQRLERAVGRGGPTEHLAQADCALAWRPSSEITTWQSASVLCVLAGRATRAGRRGQSGTLETAARIASAYADQGPACLDGLTGAFAVLVWEPGPKQGLLAVDQLGIASIVFQRTPRQLTFALELADLLPLLDRRPPPNDAAVAQWLSRGTTGSHQTLYAGVERLDGGHLLELSAGWSKRPYWSPVYAPADRTPREHLEAQIREHVADAVARQLTGTPDPGVLLSGGLDSAVVAANAAQLSPSTTAYSLVFPEHPEIDEEAVIVDLTRELGIPSRRVPFHGSGMVASALDYVREWNTPPVSPNLAVQRPLLQLAADEGALRLVDGQGGDELFGSSLYLLADLLRSGRIRRAVELSRRIEGIPERFRSRASRRALYEFGLKGSLPARAGVLARRLRRRRRAAGQPWLSPRAARAQTAQEDHLRWQRLEGPRWWAHLADELTAYRERSGAHQYLRHRNAMAGVRGGHPFLQDLHLITFVLGLPPELAFDREFDRPLLRSAMKDVVPDRVRLRAEKSYFTPLFVDALSGHDRALVSQLLTAPDAEINAYTRPDVVRERLLDAPTAQRGGSWAWALWRLVTLEAWLRGER